LFGDLLGACGFGRSCLRTRGGRSTRWRRIGAAGLFGVSRGPKRRASLAELTVTDILRACDHSRNDRRRLDGGADDATCWDADVHAYIRTTRRYHCLHPQPALGTVGSGIAALMEQSRISLLSLSKGPNPGYARSESHCRSPVRMPMRVMSPRRNGPEAAIRIRRAWIKKSIGGHFIRRSLHVACLIRAAGWRRGSCRARPAATNW